MRVATLRRGGEPCAGVGLGRIREPEGARRGGVGRADRHAALPDDLKAVIDAHPDIDEAQRMGRVMGAGDPPAKELAVELAVEQGNTTVELGPEAREAWRAAMRPVIEEWIASVDELGYDGAALHDEARRLVEDHTAQVDD